MEKMIPHFLLCYDESPACKNILTYLKFLFEGREIELSLLHVITIPTSLLLPQRDYLKEIKREEEIEKFYKDHQERIRKRFEEILQDLLKVLKVKAHFCIEFAESDRALAILQFLKDKNFDALLAGKRGLWKLASIWAGSLTQKLILYTHQPLWIVRGKDFNRKILVALDLGERGLRTAEYTGKILSFLKDYTATFMHVTLTGRTWEGSFQDTLPSEFDPEVYDFFYKIKESLRPFQLDHLKLRFKITTSFLGPTYAILKEVKRGHFTTLVVGKRGRGGFPELLLGSTATKLVSTLEDRALWLVP